MSGIVGIWYPDGQPVDVDAVGCVARRLRGAEGVQAWCEDSVGLGYLFADGAAGGSQPLQGAEGTCVLVAEARIDNRSELLRRLGPAVREQPATDAHLILAAYETWGTECPVHLIGDFAFAIWDARREQFFCARDPVGVKPFYYAFRPGRLFCFAQEVGAFRSLDEDLYRVNESMVGLYVAGRHTREREETFYRGVRRLPAAHAMVVRKEGVDAWCYWHLDPERSMHGYSDEDAIVAFRQAFEEAVRCRLPDATSAGCMLSGGLDSSAVACMAREVLAHERRLPLVTFSTIFPGVSAERQALIDERPYMDAVLQTGGFSPVWVRGDVVSPLHQLDGMLEQFGQPHDVFGAYLSWEAFRQAQERGVRVLLDGLDGDTTVSHGLGYLTELLREGRVQDFVREGEAFCRRWGRPEAPFLRSRALALLNDLGHEKRYGELVRQALRLAGVPGVSPVRLLLQALAASAPSPLLRAARRLRGNSSGEQGTMLNPAFARRIGLEERLAAGRSAAADRSFRHAHARQFTSGVWQSGLELVAALGAGFQLDVRHPFFDRRLIELSVALAPGLKLRDGWTRYVLRAAMVGILPDQVRWRVGKADLSPNFNQRLFEADRSAIEAALWQNASAIDGYLDLPALRRAYTRFIEAGGNAPAEAMSLFIATVLSRWLVRNAA